MCICVNVYTGLHAKYSLLLSDFQKFSRKNFEKYISNFMNIRPVGVELFRAEGWTDRETERQTDGQTRRSKWWFP
jgi:hypothetical protein